MIIGANTSAQHRDLETFLMHEARKVTANIFGAVEGILNEGWHERSMRRSNFVNAGR